MPRFLILASVVLSAVIAAPAQQIPLTNEKSATAIQSAELVSPWIINGNKATYDTASRGRNLLGLGHDAIAYGDRIGDHWDIFSISGTSGSRTRMIDLGEHTWKDNFTIPEVEPWPELRPGERRTIIVNTSGANGQPGSPGTGGAAGRNADGTYPASISTSKTVSAKQETEKIDYAHAPLSRQVTSSISVNGTAPKPDSYTPYSEVKSGHMYLIHVVNSGDDHYVLLRADEIIRGVKVKVSFLTFRLVDN
jgi:hypothetical protein